MSKLGLAFLFVLVFIQTVCMALAIVRINSTQERFRVEEKMFTHAVNFAVSNYLARIVDNVSSDLSTSEISPKVVYCDMGTWQIPSGYGCQIEGVRLRLGDYCEYGRVLHITSASVICKSVDGVTILKRRISTGPNEGANLRPVGPEERAHLD